MRFDTALNLLWLLLGFLALLVTLRSKRRTTWPQVLVVALVVAALFPFISATDDLLRMEQATRPTSANEQLIRLYNSVETPLPAEAPQVTFTLFFIFLILPIFRKSLERTVPMGVGRDPPVLTVLY